MRRQPSGRRARAASRAIIALVLSLLAASCAGSLPAGFMPPGEPKVIRGVPFHPQLDYQCGPASLAGVLNYLGDPVTPDEIGKSIFREGLHGTVSLDLALYPRDRGFSTRFFRGDAGALVASIDEGQPLIVMIDQGIGPARLDHFMVVVGYAPGGLIVNSGKDREAVFPWTDFLPQWSRTGNWTLAVSGK